MIRKRRSRFYLTGAREYRVSEYLSKSQNGMGDVGILFAYKEDGMIGYTVDFRRRGGLGTDDEFERFPMVLNERRLMIAVLERSLRDMDPKVMGSEGDNRARVSKRVRREALEWFESDSFEWPYSFRAICNALSLNHAAIRAKLGVSYRRFRVMQ